MFLEVFKFELRYRLRQPFFYLMLAVFFFLAFGAISTDSVQIGGAVGKVARNSPVVLVAWLAILGAIGMLVVTAFVATVVSRDHELNTLEIFLSTPLRKGPYLLGRFAASLLLALAVMIGSALGFYAGSIMPYQDPDYLVSFTWAPYLYGLGVMVLPNLLLSGAVFFSIATLTRRVLLTYAAVVAFFALWGLSQSFLGDLEDESIAALFDPFGIVSLKLMTRYWTVAENNTRMLALDQGLLLNRLLWLGLGAALLVLTLVRFRMASGERTARRRRGAASAAPDAAAATVAASAALVPAVSRSFTARTRLVQWWRQTLIEVRGILCGVPFLVLMIFGLGNLIGSLVADQQGTASYPVTRLMLQAISNTFVLVLALILMVYSAALVWKERTARMHEVYGALPVPDWLPVLAKLAALAVVAVATLFLAMLATIVFQAAHGYFRFELGLYCKDLFLVALSFWLLVGVLAFFLQVVANNRYLGFFLMILYLVLLDVLPAMGFSHHLYLFATTPAVTYSDMNGYGPFVQPLVWFNLYWWALAFGLVALCRLFWVRGTDEGLAARLRLLRRRLSARAAGLLAAAALLCAGSGTWIYYNTNVLNEYLTEDDVADLRAQYEKRYRQYDGLPQPRLAKARLALDLFPEERKVDVRGDLELANRTGAPIEALHLVFERDVEVNSLSLPDESLVTDDREVGYRIYRLDPPLAPGAAMTLSFDATLAARGFRNHDPLVSLAANGAFLGGEHLVPAIGYDRNTELSDPKKRKERGLPERQRLPPPDDPQAGRNMAFSHDADWIDFEATISTSPDQIAIAPGYLEREWIEDGRRRFHYVMDAPIVDIYAFLSADYEVARDRWNDVDIAVYYHRDHAYNVPRMIEAVQKSLAYYTANFSPYQHRQVRILEFPGYASFAQSLPNTIPYSETASFVDDVRDEEKIDMVFYITAHEVAHQWWAHQVIGSETQGSTFIIEAMAQYSALMVMEKEYGRERMKKFLAYELHRYLSARGTERIEEKPLLLVENQAYIHYYKGSLAMYALREYLGEKELNAALSRFIEDKAFRGPPYTNSLEFAAYLRDATPETYRYLFEDLIETITLYDNRADEAAAAPIGDGRYRVKLAYQSRKMRADGEGVETEIPHHDWIEIGVFGEKMEGGKTEETVLYLEKHQLEPGAGELEIVVDGMPVRAGIDPRNLLIDRVPDDNVRAVSS